MLAKQIGRLSNLAFILFGIVSLAGILLGIYLEEYVICLLPGLLILTYIAVTDFKKIFYLLLLLLPISIEYEVGGGFATDLPTEPLMIALMLIFFLFIASRPTSIDWSFVKHPIVLVLYVHLFWIVITMVNSVNPFVSTKFLLAKIWYVAVFVFLAGIILSRESEVRKFFWLIFIPMLFVIVQTLIRYYQIGFAFEEVNSPMVPFFRNHVNYAAMVTAFYPYVWLASTWYEKGTWKRRLLDFSKILFPIAIYFSYTRACYLALIVAALTYLIIRAGLLKWAVRLGIAGLFALAFFFAYNNQYLKFAPEYEKTLQHSDFGDHIVATYKLQDVSSMERFYRWIAAVYMTADRPWLGYGPGNFYPYYKKYEVSEFRTYISDNEERSTVHNYLLLMLVEQGIIGLAVFIMLTLSIFYYGQQIYQTAKRGFQRNLAMAILLSITVLYVNLMLSDLIEVDKTGSLFFMGLAMLVNLSGGKYFLKEPAA